MPRQHVTIMISGPFDDCVLVFYGAEPLYVQTHDGWVLPLRPDRGHRTVITTGHYTYTVMSKRSTNHNRNMLLGHNRIRTCCQTDLHLSLFYHAPQSSDMLRAYLVNDLYFVSAIFKGLELAA
eukprot:6207786-Pleurochrysis_carterae.AAC.2